MARTIIIDEIKKKPTDASISVDGIAKAWVNFNGTGTIAIRDSLNVSSLIDNGTGDATQNLTSAMSSADYSIAGSTIGNSSSYSVVCTAVYAPTSTSFRYVIRHLTNVVHDVSHVHTQIWGDLA